MRTAFEYNIVKRWLFLGAVVFVIAMNYLSTALPIGGQTNAEVSAKFPTLITPAGYAFAIWGVIYLTLLIFSFFQFQKAREIRFYNIIWPYFLVSCAANVLWLVCFQNEWLVLSLLCMAVLVWSLFVVFKSFYRVRPLLNTTHRFFFQVPFSMYFGWVSVAAIVNTAVVIKWAELSYFLNSEPLFATLMLLVAFGLAMYMLFANKDYVYTLTVVWALVAIWVANTDERLVEAIAKISAIVLLAMCVILFINDRVKVAQYGRQIT